MRTHLTRFVTRLRRSGVRVSVAETLDAMAAVSIAGVDRDVLREALAATLVKDEGDRGAFDAAFDAHFPLLAQDGSTGKGRQRGPRAGGRGEETASARGGGSGSGAGGPSEPAAERAPQRPPAAAPQRAARSGDMRRQAERPTASAARPEPAPRHADDADERRRGERDASRRTDGERDASRRTDGDRPIAMEPTPRRDASTTSPPRVARRPFAELDPDALDEARAAARAIGRRFAARASRRERRMRRGKIDIRRTIRRAVARGGALVDLQRRGRRPGKPHLVVLCDVSGSVARASDLLLALLAGCESAFGRITRYAFVDHLVPVEYVDGQIRPDGELDLYGFSDHGTVLAELEAAADQIDRRTVLLVLGDARNNRRAARVDVLRRLARRARAVLWVVPEPRARWDTGDSVLAGYAPACDRVLEATSLAGLAAAVREAVA